LRHIHKSIDQGETPAQKRPRGQPPCRRACLRPARDCCSWWPIISGDEPDDKCWRRCLHGLRSQRSVRYFVRKPARLPLLAPLGPRGVPPLHRYRGLRGHQPKSCTVSIFEYPPWLKENLSRCSVDNLDLLEFRVSSGPVAEPQLMDEGAGHLSPLPVSALTKHRRREK
jgi:hypothetical protein